MAKLIYSKNERKALTLALEVVEELLKAEEDFVTCGGGNDTLKALQYLKVLALRRKVFYEL